MGTTYKKLNVDVIKRIYKKTTILWNTEEYKITFNSQNSIGSWTHSSCLAYYGDIIATSTANSDRTRIITCYKWDYPTEERWSNTITWPDNNVQYTYTNFNVNLAGRVMIEKDMTITASCTRTLNNYPVKIAAGEGISNVYLSSDPNATSGSPSGTEFPFGSTVYAFAQLSHSLVPAIIVPSGWVRVDSSGSWIYRVDSKQLTPAWNLNFGTINAGLRSYAVTIKHSEGINSVFLSTNHDALSGSPSGTEFKATTTVYAFAAVHPQYVHRVPSSWYEVGKSGTSTVYMVDYARIEASPYDFGTITLPAIVTFSGTGVNWSTSLIRPQSGDAIATKKGDNTVKINGVTSTGSLTTKWTSTATAASGFILQPNSIVVKNGDGRTITNETASSMQIVGSVTVTATAIAKSTTYSLAGGNDVTVSLPSGAQMLVRNSGTSNDPDLYFSANFDLVVVADGCHWGTYELYGRPALATIYIYDHNNYEHGWSGSGTPEAEARFIMDNYTPIGVIRYNKTNNSITVSAT